ncbi:MAG: PIN domain-containing protein [Candidatus Methanoperedens sp.]|nr:PIN domain-containing protein [Candidatus Methanoperedens sp.]
MGTSMKLSSIPSGTSVFIDANIFLFEIFEDANFGDSSYDFIKKIESSEIKGYTSTLVLDEVLFKMILMEASNKFNVSMKDVVRILKQEPEKLTALEKSWENIREIQNMDNLTIFGVSPAIFKEAVEIALTCKLLPHDATHAAVAKEMNIRNIATNDDDFERMDFIKVWKP